jgi:hypothetical protein
MKLRGENSSSVKGHLETLGQNRTKIPVSSAKRAIKLRGTGSELTKVINIPKRKMISQILALKLIKVAESKGRNKKIIKSYWHMYRCLDEVTTIGTRLYGNYCRNRMCPNCIAIHKAELINRYLPVISQWPDAHLVTLIVPSIPARNLNSYMQDLMIRGIRKIIEKYRKSAERGKGRKLMGIRSLECNFNPIRRTYNPHWHLIVPDKETGETFINEWLELWRKVIPSRKAQHMRKVVDSEHDIVETIKYGTKVFTDPTVSKFKNRNITPYIYVSAMDNILCSMRNKRCFEHFGFKVPGRVRVKQIQEVSNYEYWKFSPENCGFVNFDNLNEVLFGYRITEKLKSIITHNIDTQLQ